MRPEATSVCGLKLLVYEALSYCATAAHLRGPPEYPLRVAEGGACQGGPTCAAVSSAQDSSHALRAGDTGD